jgi:hypothetical protein
MDTNPFRSGLHITLISSLETLSPNRTTLGHRASTYGFRENYLYNSFTIPK